MKGLNVSKKTIWNHTILFNQILNISFNFKQSKHLNLLLIKNDFFSNGDLIHLHLVKPKNRTKFISQSDYVIFIKRR